MSMREEIVVYLPYLLSVVTIAMTELAGRQHRHAWVIGMIGQVGWSVWIVAVGAWGLVPLNIVLWVQYIRNHFRWKRSCSLAN